MSDPTKNCVFVDYPAKGMGTSEEWICRYRCHNTSAHPASGTWQTGTVHSVQCAEKAYACQ